MSSFFTLGFSKQDQEIDTSNNNNNNNTSFHLFKNEEIYNKGFELWQQYYQLHQQKLLQNQDVEFSITPTTKPINNYNHNNSNNISNSLCLVNNTSVYDQSEYTRSLNKELMMMRQGGSGRGSGGGNETINCQDCGNQAKKDCMHMRCRTCCKSRGFHCQTHVKSTWVPAAKRRERQQQLASIQQQQPDQEQQMQHQQQLAIKRLRENPGGSGSGAAVHSQGFELGHFPSEVNSSAVFRCVRVSSMDEADEHLAYQTAVNIGGHVFKGILYDQGPDTRYPSGGEGPSHSQQQQQPHLGLIAGSSGAGTSNNQNPNVTMNEYASIYPAPLNAFMAGTQFFPPPRH